MKRLFLIVLVVIGALNVNAQETVASLTNLGKEKYNAKSYTESLDAFTKAIGLAEAEGSASGELYYLAASTAYKLKDYEKLAAFANKSIELNYTDKGARTYLFSSEAYKKLEKDSLEESVLRAGMKKFPNSKDLKERLVTRLLKNGSDHNNTAVDFQKKANENVADQAKFDEFVNKAKIEFDLAKPILEEAYNLNPEEETVKKLLVTVYDNLAIPAEQRLYKVQ